ncbi:hypothetical protein [Brevibacillus laterosporus]|uniref:hypothetical protein n=1 Tax=Brevibacillus laterosporus TaxID=1465 RepID=UPI001EF39E5D|nr:hypothetical protein [Brevibacillus laterosporus]MCG7320235.1 hypothetical protein [Brevibacillus laterosporus]
MEYNDNPINRLREILVPMQETTRTTRCRSVLAANFNIPERDTASMYKALFELITLIRKCKNVIEPIPDNSIYLEPILQAEKGVLKLSPHGEMSGFHEVVSHDTVSRLCYSADLYKRHNRERKVENEDLINLQEDVEALIEKLKDSTLPIEIQDSLIEKLNSIRKAFITIRTTGIDGIQLGLESIAGVLFLNKDEIIKNNQDENVQGVIGFLDKLNKVVQLGNGVKDLVSFFAKSLIGTST